MLSKIRLLVRKNQLIRKIIGYQLASSGLFDRYFRNYKLTDSWQVRVDDVLACSDTPFIPTVPYAGVISRGKQTMHNGLKIYNGSYYGPEYAKLLEITKGVHEPQEERVFQEVLIAIPKNATMIELGSFWSFYSMWFQLKVRGAKNYMIEPDSFNMRFGIRNFKLNGFTGDFTHAFVGPASKRGNPPTICIDDFVANKNIEFIDILHSDIQGFEYEMLQGAMVTFDKQKIGYVFISTHNNEVHYQCLDFLQDRNFIIIVDIDMDATYSVDGLIVARANNYEGIESMDLSRKDK